jgi:hypothetical protein
MDDLEHLLRSSELVHTTLPALPRETTPKQVSPPVKRLCERLMPAREPCYVRVQAAPSAKINECYKNVQVLVQQKGGRNQTGWLIWEMKGVLLNAERRACWVSPSGELIDVTPIDPQKSNATPVQRFCRKFRLFSVNRAALLF